MHVNRTRCRADAGRVSAAQNKEWKSTMNGEACRMEALNYETDGKCHNAQPGTYGHECGKPATWVGTTYTGFRSGFCDECKHNGYEARDVVAWEATDHRRTAQR